MATTDRGDAAVETLEDWEAVHDHLPTKNPSSSSSSSAAPNEWVTIPDIRQHNDTVPPINYQVLPVAGRRRTSLRALLLQSTRPEVLHQIDQPSPTISLPSSETGDHADSRERSSGQWGNRFEILKSGIAETVRRWSGGVWSCVVVAAAVLMYAKLVRWRRRVRKEAANHFTLVIREKDEKIRRLMFEIGRLKEMVMERRRVHVVRAPIRYYNCRQIGCFFFFELGSS